MTVGHYESNFDGAGVRVGIVQARFNETIGNGLLAACLNELAKLGVLNEDILHVSVPGALEIPLALKKMADTQQFDALIALGAVIRGETYHFELVSNESGAGISRVGLDYGIPIANAVLTTETDEQAEVRMQEKGRDAARVAVEMANLTLALEELADATEDSNFDA
jgi:6,7-dimethyl-8-ribityllumazine synthase